MNQKRRFKFKGELTVGDLLTVCSILVASFAVLAGWSKDRDLRTHENADRIRHSAGTVVAKLERWKERSHSFYNSLLPLLTDTASNIRKKRDRIAADSFMYRGIVEAHAGTLSAIIDEEIEIAYVDLYGYDPRIKNLFATAICRLKQIDSRMLDKFYGRAIKDLDDYLNNKQQPEKNRDPKDVDNNLRVTCNDTDLALQTKMDKVIMSVRTSISNFIRLSDEDIITRKKDIPSVDEVLVNDPEFEDCSNPQ
jgi:hypothetical protein